MTVASDLLTGLPRRANERVVDHNGSARYDPAKVSDSDLIDFSKRGADLAVSLNAITAQNSDLLDQVRCLTPGMVAPFAHRLHSTQEGDLIAPHNNEGDGEIYQLQADGSILQRFIGDSPDASRGRGRSAWYADPQPAKPIQLILVAEWMPDAIAAASKLDPETRACTRIVSTAGDLTEPGKDRLVELIRDAQQQCLRAGGGKLVLLDASNTEGKKTEARGDALHQLAAYTGARYERWAPEGHRNWNDLVMAEQRILEEASTENVSPTDGVSRSVTPEARHGSRTDKSGKSRTHRRGR